EWEPIHLHPNVVAVDERLEPLVLQARQRLEQGVRATDKELRLYEDLALYYLYGKRLDDALDKIVETAVANPSAPTPAPTWGEFLKGLHHFAAVTPRGLPSGYTPEHIFACFFQLRRAFYHTYINIVGMSAPAIRLCGAVWQAIFTHDMRRWVR